MLKKWIVTLVLGSSLAVAHAQTPSDASLDRLFELTRAERMVEDIYPLMSQSMRQMLEQANKGKELTAAQREAQERVIKRAQQLMDKAFPPALVKTHLFTVYREGLTQAEVDGLNDFYASPVGQSTITKLPQLMQRSMQLTLAHLQTVMPKITADLQREVEAAAKP